MSSVAAPPVKTTTNFRRRSASVGQPAWSIALRSEVIGKPGACVRAQASRLPGEKTTQSVHRRLRTVLFVVDPPVVVERWLLSLLAVQVYLERTEAPVHDLVDDALPALKTVVGRFLPNVVVLSRS